MLSATTCHSFPVCLACGWLFLTGTRKILPTNALGIRHQTHRPPTGFAPIIDSKDNSNDHLDI
eukprot:6213612-Pleurochrysis_carterae.AAC.1